MGFDVIDDNPKISKKFRNGFTKGNGSALAQCFYL